MQRLKTAKPVAENLSLFWVGISLAVVIVFYWDGPNFWCNKKTIRTLCEY